MQIDQLTTTMKSAFELKGSLFTLTVLNLLSLDKEQFLDQLNSSVKKTPNLFKHMPVVIDLKKVNGEEELLDLNFVTQELRKNGLIPVGIRNGTPTQEKLALEVGLGLFSDSKRQSRDSSEPVTISHTEIITKPVRSGQQVYAKNANLIILAPVGHGAEILADGFIHVYNTLRGRALAGIRGDTNARIFCQRLEAELVSIAGYYKLREEFQIPETNNGMHIFLEDKQIQIAGIE